MRPGIETCVSPDISVDSHVILYEWVCDEWWFTCSHYLDSVQNGATALYAAAQEGHVRAVELLIAAKAQVEIQNKVRFKLVQVCYNDLFTEWFYGIAHSQSAGSLWSC